MLRVSLRQLLSDSQLSSLISQLSALHLPFATLRPEQLTIAQFVELTNLVEKSLGTI